MRFYTQTQLSEHISETPEGFLVCHGVPIARTGEMLYSPDEVEDIEPGPDGLVHVERDEAAVFDPDAMASYEGKTVVLTHPGEDVTPVTWRGVAVGHAQNLRRGEGEENDLLLADLVICDQEAIALVRGGLREVSCGYDTDYERLGPGRGRQTRIMGNHIALVRRGRCGPRCRINDKREDMMPKQKKSFADTLLGLLGRPEVRKALDEAEEPRPTTEPGKEPPAAADEDRLAALEAKLEELMLEIRRVAAAPGQENPKPEAASGDEEQPAEPEAPAEPEKKPTPPARDKARDAMTATVDHDVRVRAAYLLPGMPVRDTDNRCAVQRVALRAAMQDAALSKVVQSALRGSTVDGCDCMTLDAAFTMASEVAAARNNAKIADGLTSVTARDFGKPVTPAQINEMNRKFHDGKKE